jgi:SnoaL-like domain
MANHNELLQRVSTLETKLAVLERQNDRDLEHRIGILEDVEAIKRLQRIYGYYLDALQYDAIADLFADRGAAIEIGQRGRYLGKENVRKFLVDVLGIGRPGLEKHQIINHMQHQAVVDVAPDRQRAKARWRALIQASSPPRDGSPVAPQGDEAMMWAEGVYENSYVKEDGIWKIEVMWWSPTFYVLHPQKRLWFESTPISTTFPPQTPSAAPNPSLGRVFVSYHYSHPVTGSDVTDVTADD